MGPRQAGVGHGHLPVRVFVFAQGMVPVVFSRPLCVSHLVPAWIERGGGASFSLKIFSTDLTWADREREGSRVSCSSGSETAAGRHCHYGCCVCRFSLAEQQASSLKPPKTMWSAFACTEVGIWASRNPRQALEWAANPCGLCRALVCSGHPSQGVWRSAVSHLVAKRYRSRSNVDDRD